MPHPEGYLLRAIRHLPKKARSGIYAGKHIDVANKVSTEFEVRSRKLVKPNVQKVYLYSQAMGRKVKLPVTTAALKAIDNAGGLDRYLLRTPDSLLHSDVASKLKFRLSTIYWHQEHQARQKTRGQQQQQQQALQLEQLGRGPTLLAAAQAAQRRALAAGGTSIAAPRSCSSLAGSLLPPIAAAEVAAAAAATAAAPGWLLRHS